MINIIICSHGKLASELIKTTSLICGDTSGIKAVELISGKSLEQFNKELKEIIEECKDEPAVLLTDMCGGSAFMTAVKWADGINRILLSGANLPVIMDLIFARDTKSWEEIKTDIIANLSRYIKIFPEKRN